MKTTLSGTLTLLGVAMLVLSVYQFNQYLVQQASAEPSLKQLEKQQAQLQALGPEYANSANIEETRQIVVAAQNALLQSIIIDLILGLLLLAGGFALAPKETAHVHHENHTH